MNDYNQIPNSEKKKERKKKKKQAFLFIVYAIYTPAHMSTHVCVQREKVKGEEM